MVKRHFNQKNSRFYAVLYTNVLCAKVPKKVSKFLRCEDYTKKNI